MKTFSEYINEKQEKIGAIRSQGRTTRKVIVGTVSELIEYFKYTLEVGKSYEHEKGNKKINLKPKTIKALVKELAKSISNSGNSGYYEYIEKDEFNNEWIEEYSKEGGLVTIYEN